MKLILKSLHFPPPISAFLNNLNMQALLFLIEHPAEPFLFYNCNIQLCFSLWWVLVASSNNKIPVGEAQTVFMACWMEI